MSLHDDAVRFPQFPGKAPQVLVPRVTLAGSNIVSLTANLSFALPTNNFAFDTPLYSNPTILTVYQRPTVGEGVFVPLATTYDPTAQTLNVAITQPGEFIFTYPDLPEIPLAPILYGQATSASVDQYEPVLFKWTPRGFAHSYHLQVATDPAFSNLVVDQAGLTNLTYTLPSLQAATTYYWRVNVSNYGGVSPWATNFFVAAAPSVQVTSPTGGQAWQRGQTCSLLWNANIVENVAIDLYKSESLVTHLASSAPNLGAFVWSISATNLPGSDYTIRMSSSTNASIFGVSSGPFSIVDAPTIKAVPASVSSSGLPQQFAFSAPGAATATIWGATNLPAGNWQSLGQVQVTGSNGVFAVTLPYHFYRISVP